jgi:hypothetical protein
MPVYLDTRGNSVLSVAVCDRCNRKFAYTELMPDPNFPGMRVCKDDLDNFDPWRLPARQTENIALRFPRPDVSVATGPNLLNTEGNPNNEVQYDNFFIDGVAPGSGSQGNIDNNNKYQATTSPVIPFIYTVSPTVGSMVGGTSVIITGANFNNIATVKFGGTSASFLVQNPQTIIAVSPTYAISGLVDVIVAGTFGSATSHGAFTYT